MPTNSANLVKSAEKSSFPIVAELRIIYICLIPILICLFAEAQSCFVPAIASPTKFAALSAGSASKCA